MTPSALERRLVLSYAAEPGRSGLAALLALDDALGQVLRTTREPMLGRIRLQWWRDALTALDTAPPPPEPVLAGVARALSPSVSGSDVAALVDGWETLLEAETLEPETLSRHGAARGGTLFALGGRMIGAQDRDPLKSAGAGWAVADLARNLDSVGEADAARAVAKPLLDGAVATRWSRSARALGALAHLARLDLDLPPGEAAPVGAPRRVGRLLWHRMTGR